MAKVLSDIEIAQQTKLEPITAIAKQVGLTDDDLELYGKYKAKISFDAIKRLSKNEDGKLVLVTAITPTPAGEGKTLTTIGLAQALNYMGHKAVVALREPSLGPVFGIKGGAAGGGYSQVLPMEDINLHFTGDMHAITAANNLLAAAIDNHVHQGNALRIDVRRIIWKRVMDMNDRALRNVVVGMGGKVCGFPREDHFMITVASEIMAALCLASDLMDLKKRMGDITVAYDLDGNLVKARQLGVEGAMAILMKDAIKPNLVQTIEHTPALVHGGPFANIAHGCNSVAATEAALTVGDYAITEAGFGSELGAEKFFDIKCRSADLHPSATVLVTSLRALHWHGGVPLAEIGETNPEALKKGLCNLDHHIRNMQAFGPNVVVALNHFANDDEAEVEIVRSRVKEFGARFAISDGFAKGGEGAMDLAREVVAACEGDPKPINFAYEADAPILDKIQSVVTRCYGADGFDLSEKAKKDLKQIEEWGFGRLPVCIAKTPLSLTHDAKRLGAPKGFRIPVERLILNAGAWFVVVTTGSILRMPGLPKAPNAFKIDVKNGQITGLS